jgi:hypothetical protein
MNRPASKPETRRHRRWPWLLPAALLALVPKCPLCVAAWLLASVGFGFGRAELCGARPGDHAHPILWMTALLAAFIAASLGLIHRGRRIRRGGSV